MADQWSRMAARVKERARVIVQEAYTYSGSMVIEKSPVDEGTFRNNWFSSINSPSDQTTDRKSSLAFGSPGGARYTEMLHLSTAFNIGDKLYFTNSLPYARRLEYGHSSTMAPHGIVRVTAVQWPLIVERIARRIT